ncbi:30S ribosomal protein S1 [Impatiens glandulifera]|uniref:30S ribosomal protein S1 n=1 Tax=Impatiens glandulifera TaxID=253017 RepID=UPI001FB09307|nr:30S ribosomal protein S1 [Impatiens glandulifera]
MPIFAATATGWASGIAFLSPHHSSSCDGASSQQQQQPFPSITAFTITNSFNSLHFSSSVRYPLHVAKVSVSGDAKTEDIDGVESVLVPRDQPSLSDDDFRKARRSADWKAAKAYNEKSFIYEGKVESVNGGGLLVRFYSLVGFLPYPLLSPSHSCKDTKKPIKEVATALIGSTISVKIIQVEEEKRKLILSEKEASWAKFSKQIKVGDVFDARVGYVEDYGAFVHLRFPDGYYHVTGLVHISEVSWDLVQDVRDVLSAGDQIRVKVIKLDRVRSRVILSIRQLEEDPLLETLDKVIPQDNSLNSETESRGESYVDIEPLPGLETILEELLKEEGIVDLKISRQGFEKRVVSQDLQLWLSNAPITGKQFTLLARAGRQVQEIQLTTSLDQEGIKAALQRVLERVP